jgi:hypothetical protein
MSKLLKTKNNIFTCPKLTAFRICKLAKHKFTMKYIRLGSDDCGRHFLDYYLSFNAAILK